MNKISILAATALLLGASGPALAQTKPAAAPTAPGPLSKEQQDHAIEDFGVLSSAIHSDKVPDDVKSALMGCIYSNSLGKISVAIDKLSVDNPGKIDRAKPESVLGAMAAVCGYKPSTTAAPSAAGPSAVPPRPAPGAATGR